MSLVTAPNLDALFVALRALLASVVPAGTPVLRGPINRAAQPVADHVVMTDIRQGRLRTNVTTYDDPAPESDPGTFSAEQGTEVVVQIDCYGELAQGFAVAIETIFRSEYATEALAPTCAPLHADDARQIPLTTGEEQYLRRYVIDAHLQYNPVTIAPQQFADQAEVVLVEVDVAFPAT